MREEGLVLAEVGYDRLTKDLVAVRTRAPQMTIGMVNAVAHDLGLRRGWQASGPCSSEPAQGEMPGGHDLDLLASLFPALTLQQLVMFR